MSRKRRRKCLHCGELFEPDVRNRPSVVTDYHLSLCNSHGRRSLSILRGTSRTKSLGYWSAMG